MDRRLLQGLCDVTRVVLGAALVLVGAMWLAHGARGEGALVSFVLAAYVAGIQYVAAQHPEQTPRWDALRYLGTWREAVAWGVVAAVVTALVIGATGAFTDPWLSGLIVGSFAGVVVGLWLAIRRRFGETLDG